MSVFLNMCWVQPSMCNTEHTYISFLFFPALPSRITYLSSCILLLLVGGDPVPPLLCVCGLSYMISSSLSIKENVPSLYRSREQGVNFCGRPRKCVCVSWLKLEGGGHRMLRRGQCICFLSSVLLLHPATTTRQCLAPICHLSTLNYNWMAGAGLSIHMIREISCVGPKMKTIVASLDSPSPPVAAEPEGR